MLREPLSLKEDQRGIAYEAAVAFSTLIVIAIVWNVIGPSLEAQVFEYAENEYSTGDFQDDGYGSTYNLIHIVWQWWPIILLLAVLLYLFMASQRTTYQQRRR